MMTDKSIQSHFIGMTNAEIKTQANTSFNITINNYKHLPGTWAQQWWVTQPVLWVNSLPLELMSEGKVYLLLIHYKSCITNCYALINFGASTPLP